MAYPAPAVPETQVRCNACGQVVAADEDGWAYDHRAPKLVLGRQSGIYQMRCEGGGRPGALVVEG